MVSGWEAGAARGEDQLMVVDPQAGLRAPGAEDRLLCWGEVRPNSASPQCPGGAKELGCVVLCCLAVESRLLWQRINRP